MAGIDSLGNNLTFRDLFTCGLCRENTTEPVYCPCGDIICETCYRGVSSSKSGIVSDGDGFSAAASTESILTCPLCKRQNYRNKFTNIDIDIFKNLNLGPSVELSTDPDLESLGDVAGGVFKKVTACKGRDFKRKLLCSICFLEDHRSKEAAQYQCMDCLDLLCEQCSSVHQKTRYTRNHSVAKISDLQAGDHEIERKKRYKLPCEIHVDKPLEVYCIPCGKMLCLQCKLVEHNNHICSDLGPEAATHRIKLTSDQLTLTKNIEQVDDLIQQCTKRSKLAKRQQSELKEQLKGRVEYFHSQIQTYITKLSGEVNDHYQSYLSKLDVESNELKKLFSRLTSLKLLSGRLLEQGTDVEVLSSRHHYNNKLNEYCMEGASTAVTERDDLYLNFPQTKDLAVGVLFGYLAKESESGVKVAEEVGMRLRYPNDNGKLPHLSQSGMIYDAEMDIKKGVLDRPVIKSDFKACLSYTDQFANEIKLNLLTVVMGVPKLIFSRTCHTHKCSVVKSATMSNNDIVVAVFFRNYDINQTRNCTRVRLQVYSMFGQLKMDIAYGAVIYGLAVGKEDQIVVSGGQCDVKNIDIIYKDGREATHFQTRIEPGGIAVDSQDSIVVAGPKSIEYYSQTGKLIKSFADDYEVHSKYGANKGFEHIRKELAIGPDEEVYVSDANTNSVRAYTSDGNLFFNYGDHGPNVVTNINPRGLVCDKFGNLLVCDLLTNSVHIIAKSGGLQCTILEGKIRTPRDITCFNSCYAAIAQNNGLIEAYQYMFDKDEGNTRRGGEGKKTSLPPASQNKNSLTVPQPQPQNSVKFTFNFQ